MAVRESADSSSTTSRRPDTVDTMVVHHIEDAETKSTLIIDPDIPGQLGWPELIGLARIAKSVPPNGVVVETGSLFGRSSFV
jgi:hypothetical protein